MTNPFIALLALLPDQPLEVGTITSIANGVATLTTVGGGVTTARGSGYAVGNKVFFRAGAIEAIAPNLPIEVIEV